MAAVMHVLEENEVEVRMCFVFGFMSPLCHPWQDLEWLGRLESVDLVFPEGCGDEVKEITLEVIVEARSTGTRRSRHVWQRLRALPWLCCEPACCIGRQEGSIRLPLRW